jgi:hypothetical protein
MQLLLGLPGIIAYAEHCVLMRFMRNTFTKQMQPQRAQLLAAVEHLLHAVMFEIQHRGIN